MDANVFKVMLPEFTPDMSAIGKGKGLREDNTSCILAWGNSS